MVPDALRNTVMSAEVSRLLRIFDIKSGSTVCGPARDATEVSFLFLPAPKVRPKSAKVPRRFDSF